MKFTVVWIFALLSANLWAQITIGAYNIRNFDYDQRYHIATNKNELSLLLRSLNVDVLSVEEINNTARWHEFVAMSMPGYGTAVSQCGGDHGQHLGFLFNTRKVELLGFSEDLSISAPGGQGGCNSGSRPLAIGLFQIKATKQKFFGLTAHLKSGSDSSALAKREKQYQVIKRIINDLRNSTGVQDFYLAGDLNTTEYIRRGNDYKQLNKVVAELGMVNLTANLGCSAYWWGGTDDGIENPTLLDHIIATPGLIKTRVNTQVHAHCRAVSCRQVPQSQLGISYASVSDHCPVTANIQ